MGKKRTPGNQGVTHKSTSPPKPPSPTLHVAPPVLAWIRVAVGPAFCLGGLGMIPVFFWIGVSAVYVGFLLCLAETFFEPLLKARRVLQGVTVVIVLSLCVAFSVHVVFAHPSLDLHISVNSSTLPTNIANGGIIWMPEYAALILTLENPSNKDLEQVDLVVTSPPHVIVKLKQTTDFPEVSALPDIQPGESQMTILLYSIPLSGGDPPPAKRYRIRCNRIPSHAQVNFIAAIANFGNYFSEGPGKPFAPFKYPVKTLVSGTYSASYKPLSVEYTIEQTK